MNYNIKELYFIQSHKGFNIIRIMRIHTIVYGQWFIICYIS